MVVKRKPGRAKKKVVRRKPGRPKKKVTRRKKVIKNNFLPANKKVQVQLGKGILGDLAKVLVPIIAKEVVPALTKKIFAKKKKGKGLTPAGSNPHGGALRLAGQRGAYKKPYYYTSKKQSSPIIYIK